MNVFSIGDGGGYDLTRENYIGITHKNFPFYQNTKKYKNPYFAICPACNNPIQIINLYGEQYEEEHTGRTTMHGRHFTRNVDGLPIYNEENYDACPLHNPIAFRVRRIRENTLINEEIKELIQNNRNKIAADIRKITGILLKNERINSIIDDYIAAREYCYTHTNKYNIPYSILYTREAINIFGQRIDILDLGKEITLAIKNNSRYFGVEAGKINKKVEEFVTIQLLFSNHSIQGSKQYITMCIEEKNDVHEPVHVLLRKKIGMKQYIY